jgi:hypothetical protein
MLPRLGILLLLFLSACDSTHSEVAAPAPEPPPRAVVKTATLAPTNSAAPIEGLAEIVIPDRFLQLDADIRSAVIAATFSAAQFARAEKLMKTSVAVSRQTFENAQRQMDADATQVRLLEDRLRQTWGDEAPFLTREGRARLVRELSAGTTALIRMDFPNSYGEVPANIRVSPLSGGAGSPIEKVWAAPVGNRAMPGVSYFGLIKTKPGLRAGDRAVLTADHGDAHAGLVVPHAAIVVFESEAWCYVELTPGAYERKAVPLTQPIEAGYLVETGFRPGEKVVVRGASTLLAREAEPVEDDDAEMDGGRKHQATASASPVVRRTVKIDVD